MLSQDNKVAVTLPHLSIKPELSCPWIPDIVVDNVSRELSEKGTRDQTPKLGEEGRPLDGTPLPLELGRGCREKILHTVIPGALS